MYIIIIIKYKVHKLRQWYILKVNLFFFSPSSSFLVDGDDPDSRLGNQCSGDREEKEEEEDYSVMRTKDACTRFYLNSFKNKSNQQTHLNS